MFPDLWSISKDSSSGCKLCMMDSSLLPYWPSNQCNKNKCFLQQGCRRDSAFVIDEWLSRWLMSGKAGDEVSFILHLLSSFQMWKRFCFLRQRSTTHTTTADVYSKQWPQLSFKKNGVLNKGARIGITEFSTELSSISCLAKFHFPANFSQFYDTPVKSFCRTDTRKTSRKTNKR